MSKIIGIDAGHGGAVKGATRPTVPWTESEYNMSLARELQTALRMLPWDISPILIRKRDNEYLSLSERGEMSVACKCDMVLSIHVNAHVQDWLHGGLLFHWPSNKIGQAVGDIMARSLPTPLFRRNQHSIPATDLPGEKDDWLENPRAVLAPHICTAVLLECGFISNKDDVAALSKHEVRAQLVTCCVSGILEFMRLTP